MPIRDWDMDELQTNIKGQFDSANSVFQDGRLDNLAYKHKQLYALFECLKTEGAQVLQSSPSPHLSLELEMTLRSISEALDELPSDLAGQFKAEQDLAHTNQHGSYRSRALGVVTIVACRAHPFASWAIPLSQAMVDGNSAIILASMGSCVIPEQLMNRIDRDAYHFKILHQQALDRVVSTLPEGVTALLAPRDALPDTFTIMPSTSGHFQLRALNSGPVPIIVDQSILPNGKPLSPQQDTNLYIPTGVSRTAHHISTALTDREELRPSLGRPSYVLAHENVVGPLVRALGETLPATVEFKVLPLGDSKSKTRLFLESQKESLGLSFLPIYSVQSLDMALDFLIDDIATPATAFVFAGHKFGTYTFNSLRRLESLCINYIAAENLALGPYAQRAALSFTAQAKVSSKTQVPPRSDVSQHSGSSVSAIENVKAKRLVQPSGHRIDFFGGSFLFAGGLTASLLLGGAAYGVFRGSMMIWSMVARR